MDELKEEVSQLTPARDWESIAEKCFYIFLFLLPIFVLPVTFLPFQFSKGFIFFVGIPIIFVFWLLSVLNKGQIKIPKSLIFLPLILIIIVWLVSSLFSPNRLISIFGYGYESGTFMAVLFFGLILFLSAAFSSTEKKVARIHNIIFFSAIIVFIFQVFQIFIPKLNILIPTMGLFISPTFNLIGSWNEFSIFFGFIALISLSLLELGKFKKSYRIFLFFILSISFLAMLSVNYLNSWIVFGFFIFIFLIYLLSDSFLKHSSGDGLDNEGKFVRITFFLFLIILFIILGRNLLNDFNNFLNTTSIEVRPSWSSTYHIALESFKENSILGSGPNTFIYDWLKFKPQMVNSTLFWNTRFESGFGILPSFVATAGSLGGILLIIFLVIFFVWNGGKVISNVKRDNTHVLLLSSFLGSAYLWVSLIFYSPGIVILTLAFLMTGVSLGMLAKTEKIKILTIKIFKNAKIGFASMFLITVLIILFILTSYIFSQKYWAEKLFVRASNDFISGVDLDKVETEIINATKFNKTDKYFRMLSDVNLIKTQNLLLQKDITAQDVQIQFQNFYAAAIKNARTAADINGLDPLNWMQLGKVYELAVPLNVQGASDMAINSYDEALLRSPMDPSIVASKAMVKIKVGDRVSARDLLNLSLELKNDYTSALFMLSQIDIAEGNLKSAIQRSEQAFVSSPNDIGVLFQLAMLYYNDRNFDNAQLAFEKAIILRPDYSNARYFLGLVYSKKGMMSDAIVQFKKIEEYNPDNTEVKRILNNLQNGRPALENISPPEKLPEEREKLPVEDR